MLCFASYSRKRPFRLAVAVAVAGAFVENSRNLTGGVLKVKEGEKSAKSREAGQLETGDDERTKHTV